MVYRAFLVREAMDVVRSECACAGRPMCLRLYKSVLGMALYGPLVSSCSDFCSWSNVEWSGCVNEAFQARIGNACWLYSGMVGARPRPSDLRCATDLWYLVSGC